MSSEKLEICLWNDHDMASHERGGLPLPICQAQFEFNRLQAGLSNVSTGQANEQLEHCVFST